MKFVDIHPEAKIGNNVTIGSFSSIAQDVEIGDNTWIAPNVTIMDGARIGKNCRIFSGAVISAIPQDLKFEGEKTYAEIGDNTTIRECVTINRGTKDRWKTSVGNNCLIMAYVHVAHDCVIGNNCILVNSVQLAGHVEIGEYAILGGLSAAHQFTKIGAHAMISGGSLIRKDVPPFVKAAHEPLSYVGINNLGLRRRGFTGTQIANIQEIYRVLFLKGYNLTNALEIITNDFEESPEKTIVTDFLKVSKRGIIKGIYKKGTAATEEEFSL